MGFRSLGLIAAVAVLTIGTLAPFGTHAIVSHQGIVAVYALDPTTQISIVQGSSANPSLAGYSPENAVVVIGVNNTVRWTNNDIALHTAGSTSGAFDSRDLAPGQSYSVTLSTPGTYSYVCKYHSWMHGTIVVKGNAVPEFPFPVLVLLSVVMLLALGFHLMASGKPIKLGDPQVADRLGRS
jgi:plastocyanin